MKKLLARPLRLFVDSTWLAGGALACVLACAAGRRMGLPAYVTGWLLLLALATTLVMSVQAACTKR